MTPLLIGVSPAGILELVGGMFSLAAYKGVLLQLSVQARLVFGEAAS